MSDQKNISVVSLLTSNNSNLTSNNGQSVEGNSQNPRWNSGNNNSNGNGNGNGSMSPATVNTTPSSTYHGNFYNPINDTVTPSPAPMPVSLPAPVLGSTANNIGESVSGRKQTVVKNKNNEIVVLDDDTSVNSEDDLIIVSESGTPNGGKRTIAVPAKLKQGTQLDSTSKNIGIGSESSDRAIGAKSTRVSLTSLMNSDEDAIKHTNNKPKTTATKNSTTTKTTTSTGSTSAALKKSSTSKDTKEKDQKTTRRPRKRKEVQSQDQNLNNTIIIDGKPVVVGGNTKSAPNKINDESIAPPPKKKTKIDTKPKSTTPLIKKDAKNIKDSKDSKDSKELKENITTSSSTTGSVHTTIPTPVAPSLTASKKDYNASSKNNTQQAHPKTSSVTSSKVKKNDSPLNIPSKAIKRGPKPKNSKPIVAPPLPPPTPEAPVSKPIITLPPPKLSDISKSPSKKMNTEEDFEKDEEVDPLDPLASKKKKSLEQKVEEPIVSLNIPLTSADQPPGSAQLVFNVMKLCEDKYGWKAMHPNAKYAMDDLNEEEEDDDIEEVENDDAAPIYDNKEKEKENEKENEKVKPKRKELSFEARMNRKIGKYDYEDPFIDDAELLWDKQNVSTKDGFFVYYGPLIEEGQNARIEKLDNNKRSNNHQANHSHSSSNKPNSGSSVSVQRKKPTSSVNNNGNNSNNSGNNRPKLLPLQPKSRTTTPISNGHQSVSSTPKA
ncbi:hypothetical protein PACTADRAFT_77814 [Pachysolen tannophilus NRRL Y-2460]|uniref:Hpc2-related domain-containing protein n=1 Tax=Pachysolen tannophilus NRRL Y-2460 TaxID=669874 RepID=A0A1E4TP60_PACTA|nr:hypothetical protein PACTADRAFT_77814 [Pachysolen tannophilus NRRL Y-2460]